MSRKSLEQCKSGKDFLEYASTHGGSVSYGGNHPKVTTKQGGVIVPVPYHGNHDLGTGLRHKLIKAFISIGILILLVGFMVQAGII